MTYDPETTRFKMWVERDGGVSETTPQQFELDAGNHSRKWKSSFRLLGGRRPLALALLALLVLVPVPLVLVPAPVLGSRAAG